ncbi:hypothetical protein BAME_04130 [Bacillus sp. M 2-6]|nr:hypothetical protein BAME_04130 [Bacillus sp. M 2-6]
MYVFYFKNDRIITQNKLSKRKRSHPDMNETRFLLKNTLRMNHKVASSSEDSL